MPTTHITLNLILRTHAYILTLYTHEFTLYPCLNYAHAHTTLTLTLCSYTPHPLSHLVACLREMTLAFLSRVACCPVGTIVLSLSLLITDVRLFLFTSGKYLRQSSVSEPYCSPFHVRKMAIVCLSLHSTSCRVDSNSTVRIHTCIYRQYIYISIQTNKIEHLHCKNVLQADISIGRISTIQITTHITLFHLVINYL